MKAIRRMNAAPFCVCLKDCPDFFELDNGDFALIGEDITAEAANVLPPEAGVGVTERLIRVPRRLILESKQHIPNA